MLLHVSGVNYNLNSNYNVFGTTLLPTFCLLENFRRKFANLVALPTPTKRLECCKAHQIL